MEQRQPRSSKRQKGRRAAATAAALLAAGWMVQCADAAATRQGSSHRLQSRQYPSDAPACAQLCIRVKIEEAADPGLAPTCDYRDANYVGCLCASTKFTAAYERCLLDNCIFPASLAAGRSLFQTFCAASGSASAASQAVSVASSAVASQASLYSATATGNTTASSTTATSASSSASTTTSGAISSGPSSSVPTGTGTAPQSGTTNPASPNTQSTLNAAQVSSARMNATGVSSARHAKVSLPSWTLAASATFVLLGSLAVMV